MTVSNLLSLGFKFYFIENVNFSCVVIFSFMA